MLQRFAVPLCADESCHTRADVARCASRYQLVNVKLDKAGGLTEALAVCDAARAHGLGLMVGCMLGTSLAMAPATLIAADAEFVDLDGPLWMSRDRQPSLVIADSKVGLPRRVAMGVSGTRVPRVTTGPARFVVPTGDTLPLDASRYGIVASATPAACNARA